MKPHEKSPEESSDDRQIARDRIVPVERAALVAPTMSTPDSRPPAPDVVEPQPDPDAEIDACDVEADAATKLTEDEELPAARGGVA